jgi:hypothetical protein
MTMVGHASAVDDGVVNTAQGCTNEMNASVTALIFVGLLLTVLGLFVAGSLALIGLGVASLFGAGLFQAFAARDRSA